MIAAFRRIIKSGWQGFFRDGHLALATIFILAMTVILVVSFFFMKDIGRVLISSLREKVDISVYFKDGTSEEDILKAKVEILDLPEVKDVNYVSADEALLNFVEKNKDDPVLMESLQEVGGNPFLASLGIKSQQASQYEAISVFLSESDFSDSIEKIDYFQRKSAIDKIFSVASLAEKFGIGLAIILTIVAVLITFNTIRLTIYNQREEIKIQRLVGASSGFIRGPFIFEGVVLGTAAALISLLIFSLACWILAPKAAILLSDINIFQLFISSFWSLLLIQFITGVGLGVFSSLIAIRKYLKV
ncbi:MAG: permease-like cell division protein FtsX [Candidatus Paceibacterota bacterium]